MPKPIESVHLTSRTAEQIADKLRNLVGNNKFKIQDNGNLLLSGAGIYVTTRGSTTTLHIDTDDPNVSLKLTTGRHRSWVRFEFLRGSVQITSSQHGVSKEVTLTVMS